MNLLENCPKNVEIYELSFSNFDRNLKLEENYLKLQIALKFKQISKPNIIYKQNHVQFLEILHSLASKVFENFFMFLKNANKTAKIFLKTTQFLQTLTRSVSLPPTILNPNPILSLLISIVVSLPGLIGHEIGSRSGSVTGLPWTCSVILCEADGGMGDGLGDGVAGFVETEGVGDVETDGVVVVGARAV